MRDDPLPEMVERIRNALLLSLRSVIAHDSLAREKCENAAREVIRVMQSPNDDMLRAMNEAVYLRHEPPEGVYHAAVSAALGKAAPGGPSS
ncbi:MAG: hypothetical protein ACHQF3_13950 [Alphaproteobacteria bacterium]